MKNEKLTRRKLIQGMVPAILAGSTLATSPNVFALSAAGNNKANVKLKVAVPEDIWLKSKRSFQEMSVFLNNATSGTVDASFLPQKASENNIVESLQHGHSDLAIEQRSKWFLSSAAEISLHMQSAINRQQFKHWFNADRKKLIGTVFYQHGISPLSYDHYSFERPMGMAPQQILMEATEKNIIYALSDQIVCGLRGFYKNAELNTHGVCGAYGILANVSSDKMALIEIDKVFDQLALATDDLTKEYYFHNILGAPLYEPVDAFSNVSAMTGVSQEHQVIINHAMQTLTKAINNDFAEISFSVLHKQLDPSQNKVIKTAVVKTIQDEITEQVRYLSKKDEVIHKLILS